MDNNQIRLRWTSHQGTILSIFDALLTSEAMVDVTLAAEGQFIRAHRVILSACSPYFQELLGIDNSKHPILFLKDVKFAEVKALVHYMYRGEVNIPQDDLQSLLNVAQSLKVRGLAEVETNGASTGGGSGSTGNLNLSSDTLVFPNVQTPTTSTPTKPFVGPKSQVPKPPPTTPAPTTTTYVNVPTAPVQITPVPRSAPAPHSAMKRPRIETVSSAGTSSSRISHHAQAQAQAVQESMIPVDPLGGATDANYVISHHGNEQGELESSGMEGIRVEEGVKLEVDDGVVTVEDDENMEQFEQGDEEENSMSQSSFNESWTNDGMNMSHLMTSGGVDDGEIPGTSRGTTGETEGPNNRPPSSQSQNSCEKCGKLFTNPKSLWRHGQNSSCAEKQLRYGCPLCPKVFTRPDNLRRHYVCSHSVTVST